MIKKYNQCSFYMSYMHIYIAFFVLIVICVPLNLLAANSRSTNEGTLNVLDNRPSHESNPNNNKFVFEKYLTGQMDSEGNPIESSYKWISAKEDNMFEIEIVYHNSDMHPATIYLNEIDANSKIVHTEKLAELHNKYTAVEYKQNGININSAVSENQVSFSADGSSIIVFSTKNGGYANNPFRIFDSGKVAIIYKIRYDVLKQNLKKYYR